MGQPGREPSPRYRKTTSHRPIYSFSDRSFFKRGRRTRISGLHFLCIQHISNDLSFPIHNTGQWSSHRPPRYSGLGHCGPSLSLGWVELPLGWAGCAPTSFGSEDSRHGGRQTQHIRAPPWECSHVLGLGGRGSLELTQFWRRQDFQEVRQAAFRAGQGLMPCEQDQSAEWAQHQTTYNHHQ